MRLTFPDQTTIDWPTKTLPHDGIELTTPTDRADWLALRQRDVTASVAGALLGVHDFQSALGLWGLKVGRIQEDPEESSAMRRGRMLEPVALQMLREERPGWKIGGGVNFYWRDPQRRIGATPDCYVIDENGDHCIVQFKTVEPSVFVAKWQGGDRYGVVDPPLWIVVQALIEAYLTGAKRAFVAALVVSFGIDLKIIEIPLHAGVLERLFEEVAAFWNLVASGKTPAPDYGQDAELIAKFFPVADGLVLDLTDDNQLPDLVARDERLRLAAKAATDERAEVRAEIAHKLGIAAKLAGDGRPGESTVAIYQGGIVSAKNVFRASYTVKDTTYLDLRCKPGKSLGDEKAAKAVKPKRGATAPKKPAPIATSEPEVF